MLTVTNYKTRISKEGKEYLTLEIQGGLEMIQSQVTGRFYATVRKSSVTTTFGEDVAKMLIGTQIPGKIVRVECDAYEYTIQNTGEVVTLTHSWTYQPEETTAPELCAKFLGPILSVYQSRSRKMIGIFYSLNKTNKVYAFTKGFTSANTYPPRNFWPEWLWERH